MTDTRATIAARNNAEWCHAVCSAHGAAGTFSSELWVTRGEVPELYPNLVTLAPAREEALRIVDGLSAAERARFSVKDSFATLELGQRGYRRLLQARWLWKASPDVAGPSHSPAAGFVRVRSAEGLLAWEQAWSGDDEPLQRVTFPASLLADEDLAFLQLVDGPEIVAGLIANRAAGAVGISNLFLRAGPPRVFADALRAIEALYPGLPLVGYQPIDSLAQAQRLGFEVLPETLRVWVPA